MQAASSTDVRIVDRYVLYGEFASGGMASVHFGRLLGAAGFSRPVAIKRLHEQLASDPHVRASFVDEAHLASRIRHPNVVPTLDVVATGGQLLLVMEYVTGESLAPLARAMRARRLRIPWQVSLAIMANVLHGLHAAHEATTETGEPLSIVHRDVSPQNILVGVDGVSRVLDFGIARAAVRIETTRAGMMKGKLAYMAPEQFDGDDVTRSADIYAAGVVLWELLAGRRLFYNAEDGVLLEKILQGKIDPPSATNDEISPALDAIVMRALARTPEHRHATALEMALALEAVGPHAGTTEIGRWVERTAAEALAVRAHKLRELERTSSQIRLSLKRVGESRDSASLSNASTSPLAMSTRPQNVDDLSLPITPVPRGAIWISAALAVTVAVLGSIAFGENEPSHGSQSASAAAAPAIAIAPHAIPIQSPPAPEETPAAPPIDDDAARADALDAGLEDR